MQKPYIIGICGGSGSGKTYLLEQLIGRLAPDEVTLVSQDNYYRNYQDQKKDPEGLVNFDHPESVDLNFLVRDIQALLTGKTLERQEYTFNNPLATARTFILNPAPIIILEGLFIFYQPELVELFDLKVFVEAHEHIKLVRRLKRDNTERGYSIDSILRDYERFVAPMYNQFVAPARQICDVIVPNHEDMHVAMEVLFNHVQTVLSAPSP